MESKALDEVITDEFRERAKKLKQFLEKHSLEGYQAYDTGTGWGWAIRYNRIYTLLPKYRDDPVIKILKDVKERGKYKIKERFRLFFLRSLGYGHKFYLYPEELKRKQQHKTFYI